MSNTIRFIFLFAFLLIATISEAQMTRHDSLYTMGICDQMGYCIPRIQNLPRPKGVEFNYIRTLNHKIETEYEDTLGTFSDQINVNRRFEFKLKVPVLRKKSLTLVLGLEYKSEEFKFREPDQLSPNFYRVLEDKSLRTFGSDLIMMKTFKGQSYLAAWAKFRLSGDLSSETLSEQFRTSLIGLYGRRASSSLSWGIGLSYSFTFGRETILPILSISKKFNEKWSLETLLPLYTRLRFMQSEKDIFYLTVQLRGDKYFVDFEGLFNNKLYVELSEIFGGLIYEREIHDFLWFKLALGGRTNIKFNLSESVNFIERSNPVVKNTLSDALQFQVGLFIVPPKKWLEKND